MTPKARLFQGQGTAVWQRVVASLLVAALSLSLPSCTSVPAPAPAPVQAKNVCEMQASLVNPAVGSGLGGTGMPAVGSGMGGTGKPAIGSGLGGTGSPAAQSDPGGIGGTGSVAGKPVFGEGGVGGTGIVGVITGFASICVNGLEVQYDANTPVWDNGQPGSTRQLVVGQVVSVTATGSGDKTTARGIGMIHAVVGPLTTVDAAKGTLQVLGQKATALEPRDLANLRAGQWVRVSGQWRDCGIACAGLASADGHAGASAWPCQRRAG
jgi:hypothetical protein